MAEPVIRKATSQDLSALARLRREFTLEDGPKARDYRNRGLGGRVLEATKEWAREEDVELLVVWPSEESVSFYLQHGFAGSEPLVWMSGTASD